MIRRVATVLTGVMVLWAAGCGVRRDPVPYVEMDRPSQTAPAPEQSGEAEK